MTRQNFSIEFFPPKTPEGVEKLRIVRAKLAADTDLWVASANATGDAYLVPLSFSWDGEYLTVATPQRSRTARNLRRARWARMALGPTRDVVIVEGPVEEMAVTADDTELTRGRA